MGQCTSNKAKGNLSVKKIISQKKPKKMDKHKHFKEPKEEDNRHYPSPMGKETNKLLDPNKKPAQNYSKGVAMSFGFKKRPTPMTSNASLVAWEAGSKSDANGNKDDTRKDRNPHKPPSSQKQSNSITQRPSRFSFPQTNTERTNKVADIKPNQFPRHFDAPGSRRTSPVTEPERGLNRTFTRNVTIVTRTEVTEKDEVVKDGYEPRMNAVVQTGKFTLQTTRLPQPEPIRVIETKTAKTIANNNRRSARMWRQQEETSLKTGNAQFDDSGFESNASGALGENENIRERLQGPNNRFSLLENSDSFSDVCTPPPLPELPSVFNIGKSNNDSNKEQESTNIKDDLNCRKTFLKSNGPNRFLKTRARNLLDSPQSSSDQEWVNGGEAMADDVSLILSPHRTKEETTPAKKPTAPKSVTEAVLQTILQPTVSLEMIDSLKDSMNLSLSDEDPHFAAMATNNNTGTLLDDEILSPVESLLSSSETDEEVVKKKIIHSSNSNSKDVNEKLTPSSPGSPSNATYSLSLSDDKEDFLIDDEIADQPELVFEDRGAERHYVEKDSLAINQRRTSHNSDLSPLPLRKKREFLLKSTANQGSFDSLSPCDSIASEDMMMDYDVSQTHDVDIWDRRSSSFSSLDNNPKPRFKANDASFINKNFFKSFTPKQSLATNSPHSLKSRASRRSSPECRSPKRNHFNPLAYDPASESLTLTRANHSAIQQDIIGIKTMLLTLKRVLNESETHNSLKNCTEEPFNNNNNNNNNNNEFRLELADLRRQVIFLQGQLEDKEKAVSNLQKQIDDLATQNTPTSLDNVPVLPVDIQNRCNAATQTERARPLSSGVFSVTASPIDDNNPILRFIIQ